MLEVELLQDQKMNSLKVKENTFFNLRSSFFGIADSQDKKNGPLENSNNKK